MTDKPTVQDPNVEPDGYRPPTSVEEALQSCTEWEAARFRALGDALDNESLEGCPCTKCLSQLQRQYEWDDELAVRGNLSQNRAKERMREYQGSTLERVEASFPLHLYCCRRCSTLFVGMRWPLGSTVPGVVTGYALESVADASGLELLPYAYVRAELSVRPFVEEIWTALPDEPFSVRELGIEHEDSLSSAFARLQLRPFFEVVATKLYAKGATYVKFMTELHAGLREAGRRTESKASGADIALWMGSMTEAELTLLDRCENEPGLVADLPDKIGSGLLLQAKKATSGYVDKGQVRNLVRFSSLSWQERMLAGFPGKVFIGYSGGSDRVEWYGSGLTESLAGWAGSGRPHEKMGFGKAVREHEFEALSFDTRNAMTAYLVGVLGSPQITLKDVLVAGIPTIIFGLPPGGPPGNGGGGPSTALHDHVGCLVERILNRVGNDDDDGGGGGTPVRA